MISVPDRKALDLCAWCPNLCLARCPVSLASGDLAWSPWGKQSHLWRRLRGEAWAGEESVKPLYMCLGCLACQELCRHGVDVPSNLFAGRALAREQLPAAVPDLSAPPGTEEAWRRLQELAPSWRRSDQSQALLVLEAGLLTTENEAWLRQVFKALDAVEDQTIGVTRDSVLESGWREWQAGRPGAAKEQARHLWERLGRYRRAWVVAPEAAAFMMLDWPAMGMEREKTIRPLLAVLASLRERLNPLEDPPRLALHDPCRFGRHLAFHEPPRLLLEQLLGAPIVELPCSGRDTICCGAGGGMDETAPDLAEAMAGDLWKIFEETGAEGLVTSCPSCHRWLSEVGGERVVSIYELIGRGGDA